MKFCVETWTLMSHRPVTYKKFTESLGKQHDMQVHVILNPQHERARFVTPLSPSQIQEGSHHVYKAN